MNQGTRSRVNGKIRELRLTQGSFAELVGMNPKTFNRKMRGHADFTFDEVSRMIDAMGIRDDLSELHRIFFDYEDHKCGGKETTNGVEG